MSLKGSKKDRVSNSTLLSDQTDQPEESSPSLSQGRSGQSSRIKKMLGVATIAIILFLEIAIVLNSYIARSSNQVKEQAVSSSPGLQTQTNPPDVTPNPSGQLVYKPAMDLGVTRFSITADEITYGDSVDNQNQVVDVRKYPQWRNVTIEGKPFKRGDSYYIRVTNPVQCVLLADTVGIGVYEKPSKAAKLLCYLSILDNRVGIYPDSDQSGWVQVDLPISTADGIWIYAK